MEEISYPDMDAERRRDLVDTVRRALGDVDAVHGLRAVRTLSLMRKHPADTAARAAALAVPSDGTMAPMSGVPDAWPTRNHEVQTDRSTKGVQTVKRVKVGMASVIGGTHAVPPTDVDAATADDAVRARTAAAVLLRGVRWNLTGAVTLEVQRITDICYRGLIDDEITPMIGTDVTSFEQVIGGDITDRAETTVATSYLSGPYADARVDALACPAAVYRAQTRRTVHTVKHATRVRLNKGRNRTGDVGPTCRAGILRTVSAPYTPPALVTPLVWSLVAPGPDTEHRWHGHQLVTRPAPTRKARTVTERVAASKRNAARTIGTIDAPTTAAGWQEILDGLNRGERVKVWSDIGTVTITRNAQRYNANDKRDGRVKLWKVRNAATLADALA